MWFTHNQNYHLLADKPNGKIVIKCGSQSLESVRTSVLRILEDEKRRLADPANIKKTRGVSEYLLALGTDTDPVSLPSYWTSRSQTNTQPAAALKGGNGTRFVVDKGLVKLLSL